MELEEEQGALTGERLSVKLANDITYKRYIFYIRNLEGEVLIDYRRMNQTMTRLEKTEARDLSTLARVLFGLDAPSPVSQVFEEVQFIDQTLNDSQRDAIRFALASREVALIHGPPGVWAISLQRHNRSN